MRSSPNGGPARRRDLEAADPSRQGFVSVLTGLKKPAFRQRAGVACQSGVRDRDEPDRHARANRAPTSATSSLRGTDVSVSRIDYLSTKLTPAKFAALRLAVADARKRARTIAAGLGARLGAVQQTKLGVYQITPRNSTEVSDYGIDDVIIAAEGRVKPWSLVTFRVDGLAPARRTAATMGVGQVRQPRQIADAA